LALTSSSVPGAVLPTPTFVEDPEKIVPVPLVQVSARAAPAQAIAAVKIPIANVVLNVSRLTMTWLLSLR
jgi:hypothetical protein